MSVEPIKGVLSAYTNPLYGTLASELLRGYSAYNIAVMEGYEGTIDEWLESLTGPKGDKGDQGDPGPQGEKGDTGLPGLDGETGPKGDKGDKGDTGNGIYAVVLRSDYTLSIYLTDGSVYNTPSIRGREGAVGPAGPVGPQGETGAKGDKGDTGNAGTGISSIVQNADHSLTINLDDGTSYTTDPVEALKGDTGNGISSIVMKSDYTLQINMTNGSSYNTPSIRGVAGEKGDKGDKGDTGATGPQGPKGDPGNKGDKGDTGATGPQGPKGDPGALNFHICSQIEYDATTRVPTIQNPEDDTFYLVPSASVTSPDLFVEWIYVNNAWEMFGSATVDLSQIEQDIDDLEETISGKYTKPVTGIPASDLASGVIPDVSGFYTKPSGGIPSSDLSSGIQTSLGKADTAYQKPSGGIPASDLASGVVQDVSGKADKVQSATTGNFASLDSNGNLVDSGHKHSDYLTQHQDISGKADKVQSATTGNFASLDSNGNLVDSGHKHSDYLTQHQDITGKADKVTNPTSGNFAGLDSNGNLYDSGSKPSDFLTQHQDISGKADKVQSATSGNFASLDANGNLTDSGHKHSDYLTQHQDLSDYVKDDDWAGVDTSGVIMLDASGNYGIYMTSGHYLRIYQAADTDIKSGTNAYRPITAPKQHQAVFYGLAKAAGDTTQSSSSNAVGTYTETAQSKIHEMLGAPVTVSGTTPTITGKAGIRYICGEVSTLSITPPASGIIDVVFTSGSTPTVLTVPNTVKFPDWFDPTSLVANTVYEINIADGVYGAVMAWT